ncbi:hypothetical protein D3C79_1067310 [compost metagenome]
MCKEAHSCAQDHPRHQHHNQLDTITFPASLFAPALLGQPHMCPEACVQHCVTFKTDSSEIQLGVAF